MIDHHGYGIDLEQQPNHTLPWRAVVRTPSGEYFVKSGLDREQALANAKLEIELRVAAHSVTK